MKDRLGRTSRDSVAVEVFMANLPFLIFENLTWVIDSVNNIEYMKTPPIVGKHTVDEIVSVSIHTYDIDYRGYLWRKIERDGTTKNNFYYKIEDDAVVVYMYYTTPRSEIEYFVKREIKVTFRQ